MDENQKTVTEQLSEIREANAEQAKALAREYYAQALENPNVSWGALKSLEYQNLKSVATGWPIVDNPNATMSGIGLAAKDVGKAAIEPVTNTGEWLLKRAIDEVKFIQDPISSLKQSAEKVIDATVGNHMAERQALAAVMRIDDENTRIAELTRAEWRPLIGLGLAATGPRIALDTPAATAAATTATVKALNSIATTGEEGLATVGGMPIPNDEVAANTNKPHQAEIMKASAVHPDEANNMEAFGNNLKLEEPVIPREATEKELLNARKGNGRSDVVPGFDDYGFINKMEHVGKANNGIKVVSFTNKSDIRLFNHVGTDINEISLNQALYQVAENPEVRADLLYSMKKLGGEKQIETALTTEPFFKQAVAETEAQLSKAIANYDYEARVAKTYGETLNRYSGHEEALARVQLAGAKKNFLQSGLDASINNPVIASLSREGKDSSYFKLDETLKEVAAYDPRKPANAAQDAADMALEVTAKAHAERRNFLLETKQQRGLTPTEQVELNVGDKYGADAAAYAKGLIQNGGVDKIDQLYPTVTNNKSFVERNEKDSFDLTPSKSPNPTEYLKLRSDLINNLSVAELRKLGKSEIEAVETVINIRQEALTAHLPEGVERRASRDPLLPNVVQTSRDEYLIAKSGEGKRFEDASIFEFSKQNSFEGFQIQEAARNHAIAELNAIRRINPKYELKQYQEVLDYMKTRQAIIEGASFDDKPEALRNYFKSEGNGFIKALEELNSNKADARNENLSLKGAIQHLDNPKAQETVLARIIEQQDAINSRSVGTEHA